MSTDYYPPFLTIISTTALIRGCGEESLVWFRIVVALVIVKWGLVLFSSETGLGRGSHGDEELFASEIYFSQMVLSRGVD